MILGPASGYFIATLLIFVGVDFISVWGFDLQYGTTRVVNLSFIASQAAGAYVSAVLTVGPARKSFDEQYLFGAKLPFPVPWVAGIAAGAALSLVLGAIVVPRLRDEYFAIVTLVVGVGILSFVSAYVPLFNGDTGVSGVPLPFTNSLIPTAGGLWTMVALTVGLTASCYFGVRRIHMSPLSRRLRAIRDNEGAARSVGVDASRLKLVTMVVGGALGGLSGVLLVNAFGAWNTGSWQISELVFILTAVIIGGSGNLWGGAIGILVLLFIGEGLQFVPGLRGSSNGELNANIQAAITALLEIAFFWFRPAGVLPERVRRVRGREVQAGAVSTWNANPAAPQPGLREDSGRSPTANGRVAPSIDTVAPEPSVGGGSTAVELKIEELEVCFGGVVAVRDCSFSLRSGITFLVGPNGAGKTTVAACVAGTVRPRSGRITFDGRPLQGPVHARAGRGVVRTFQLPQEFGTMTALENVMVALPGRSGTSLRSSVFSRRWRREEAVSEREAADILRLCGLAGMANEQAGKLSGGQKKLLELARALACRPRLLLLDEPTAGVSPHLFDQISELLRRLSLSNISLLIITHEMSLVRALSDDVIVMSQGRVLAQGRFEDVSAERAVQDAYLGRLASAEPEPILVGANRAIARDSKAFRGGSSDVVLSCRDLDVGYGGTPVVSAFSLTCAAGEIIALIGPNGCGKSTLLKRIAGLLPETAGTIEICGNDSTKLAAGEVSRLGLKYVPQVRDIFPSLSVEENLLAGTADKSKIDEVMAVFPILERLLRRKAGRLSGGERKALAIARAFMTPRVAVLMLDEPSAALSPQATAALWPVVERAAKNGVGVIVVEQRVDDVLALADRAYVMVDGRNRLDGSAADLRDRASELGRIFVGT